MHRTLAPLAAALFAIVLGFGSTSLAQTPPPPTPTTLPAGSTTHFTTPHGFHGQTIEDGQTDVTLTAINEIEGVEVCGDHNTTSWHPLVQRDAAGTITCTYGHEHHADPNSVNDVFGAPGAWFGASGQAISYPWQTSSQIGLENTVKHEGYKWYVERDMECRPNGGAGWTGCLRAWRVQVHSMGHASDAVARFHSYSMELLVEFQGNQGIVRHGGHIDFGHLSLNAGGGQVCPPLIGNPETFTCGANHHRETGARDVPAPYGDADRGGAGWYGVHLVTALTTTIEDWGPISYTNPTSQLFYPADRRMNNSKSNLGNMSVSIPSWIISWTAPGPVNFDGYTDQHGKQAAACMTPGPMPDSAVVCSRLVFEHIPNIVYLWNATRQGMPAPPEYDVLSPITGNSLIRFPN
jgi:hypothetical protein